MGASLPLHALCDAFMDISSPTRRTQHLHVSKVTGASGGHRQAQVVDAANGH